MRSCSSNKQINKSRQSHRPPPGRDLSHTQVLRAAELPTLSWRRRGYCLSVLWNLVRGVHLLSWMLFQQWRTQKGSGGSPQIFFLIFRLKNTRFFKFRGTLPDVCPRLMLPVVVAQSYCSFTPEVNAFQQAPPLQGRKLVIDWKT